MKTPNCSLGDVQVKSIVSTTPLFENKDYLIQKYTVEKLSARQIAVLIGCAHSTINDALARFGITKTRRIGGHVPYGYKMENGRRVPHVREQKVIDQILRAHDRGWSNRRIAEWLNSRGVKSPSQQGRWYGPAIARIIRVARKGP